MGVITTFDPVGFVALFPEFAPCTPAQLSLYFRVATRILANDGTGPISDAGFAQDAFNFLTAHIAWLSAPRDQNGNPAAMGVPAPQILGMLNSAGEGSVNIGFDMGDVNAGSPSQAWYMKTTYGQTYWTMMAQFRTAIPVLHPTRVGGPLQANRGWRGGVF